MPKITLEYRHPEHCPEWTEVEWPFNGNSVDAENDLAENLADDWANDGAEDIDRMIIGDDLEIRVVMNAVNDGKDAKPCPYCGGQPFIARGKHGETKMIIEPHSNFSEAHIECSGCRHVTPISDREEGCFYYWENFGPGKKSKDDMNLLLEMAELTGFLVSGDGGGFIAGPGNPAPDGEEFTLIWAHPTLGFIFRQICSDDLTVGQARKLFRQLFREMELVRWGIYHG